MLAFTLMPTTAHAATKGLAINNSKAKELIEATHASWYYTWGQTPISSIENAEFVPMLWGARHYRTQSLPQDAKAVLLFNEPDHKGQSNLTVERAISTIKDAPISIPGIRVGSPAPMKITSGWLEQFMQSADNDSLQIDFIAVHWYGPPDAKKFLADMDETYQRYKKPLWITEFAVADWAGEKFGVNRYSTKKVRKFMEDAITGINERAFVERYAWYSPSTDRVALKTARLWTKDGQLTELGELYASLEEK